MSNWRIEDDGTVVINLKNSLKQQKKKPKMDGLYADGEPDYFNVFSSDTFVGSCTLWSRYAIPFVIANNKLYVGRRGYPHDSCGCEPEEIFDGNFAYGRLWLEVEREYADKGRHNGTIGVGMPYSVLAFWYEDAPHTIDVNLVNEFLERCGVDKNQVLVASFENDGYGKIYPYSEWNFKTSQANERQKEVRAMHLMNANDKHNATAGFRATRDRKIGQKLTNGKGQEMPVAQYRSMIYGENIHRIIRNVLKEYIYKNTKRIIF